MGDYQLDSTEDNLSSTIIQSLKEESQRNMIQLLKQFEELNSNNISTIIEAYRVLKKIFKNVTTNSNEDKYSTLNCNNPILKRKLTDLPYGEALLTIGGFELIQDTQTWHISKENIQHVEWCLEGLEKHIKEGESKGIFEKTQQKPTAPVKESRATLLPPTLSRKALNKEKEEERQRLLLLVERDRLELEAERSRLNVESNRNSSPPVELSSWKQVPPFEQISRRRGASVDRIQTLSNLVDSKQPVDEKLQNHKNLLQKFTSNQTFEGCGYKISTPSTANIIASGTIINPDEFTGVTALNTTGKPTQQLSGISQGRVAISVGLAKDEEPEKNHTQDQRRRAWMEREEANRQKTNTSRMRSSSSTPQFKSLSALRRQYEQQKKSKKEEGIRAFFESYAEVNECITTVESSPSIEVPFPKYARATMVQEGKEVAHEVVAPYWVSKIRVRKLSTSKSKEEETSPPVDSQYDETINDTTTETINDTTTETSHISKQESLSSQKSLDESENSLSLKSDCFTPGIPNSNVPNPSVATA